MTQQLCRLAKDDAGRAPVATDHVVCNQAMAAHHELESAFALADAALSNKQDSHSVDFDENSVELHLWR
jgi:hypothetical protein